MSIARPPSRDAVRDQRIERLEPLIAPAQLLYELPLSDAHAETLLAGRQSAHAILDREDDRLLVVVGPCSVHDPDATLEYAEKLALQSARLQQDLCIAMRVYFEKPRTTTGWKGLINDPHLDGSGDVNFGLRLARQVLLGVLKHGLAVGCEFLDPIMPQYISDAVCWGAIGARTVESQIHRQLGSGLSMPVGFKNRTDGNIQVAVDAVRAAAVKHAFAGIAETGEPAIMHTRGNVDCHIILRGGRDRPNFDTESVAGALELLRAAGLPERMMVDLSHDNSGKDPDRQPHVGGDVAGQIAAGNNAIAGVMIESFLVGGRQDPEGPGPLRYGQSVTDGCLGWEPTVELLEQLADAVRTRRAMAASESVEGVEANSARMRITVIGVGLIGGSIGLAAKQRLGATVTGTGHRRASLERALERGAVDRIADTVEEAVAGADVVFVGVPVGLLPATVAEAVNAAAHDCVVTDVGSTKRAVVAAVDDPRFVGGHPLAGAETTGVEHARADLFDNAVWYLTPTERTSGVLYERLHRLIHGLGARPSAIDADLHDTILASVSHLPHVFANVLVAQAAGALAQERLPATGPSFRDATRVAGASSAIWTDIYLSNRDALGKQIDDAIDRLGAVRTLLATSDNAGLTAWNDAAADARRRLLEAQLAGGTLYELRASVPNRPGVIAQLALELGRAGVNITDMALYPAADMSEGVVAMWIAGEQPAERAEQIVLGLGFPVARA